MPEPTEQQPENTKPKQSAYLVCEGALCKCSAGTKPVKLKVDSHKKAYINNDKLLATVKDVTFELPANTFGTCNNNSAGNNVCQPQFEKWLKPYKDIEVEGNQVITDQSELKCIQFEGTITIEMHGQQQDVNAAQAENMDKTIAVQVNPLASLAPLNVDTTKKVGVTSIQGELVDDPKYKTVTNQKIKEEKSIEDNHAKDVKHEDPVDIYVRPGQEIKFTATYSGTAALVCWKVAGAKGPMHFLQHGPVYKTSFPEVGKYTIEGYGTNKDHNLDIDTKIVDGEVKGTKEVKSRADDKTCMFDILVQDNKLTGICHVESANVIDKMDKGKFVEAQVRVGLPVTFEPVYLMPPVQTEIDELILLIKDASGNELKRCKGQPNIVFEAQNSAANYSVEAYFDGSEEKPFSYKFRTALNSVSVIAVAGMETENARIRPGTTLSFSVGQSKFMNDYKVSQEVLDAEQAAIKWYESSNEPVATGITTYSKTYQREGEYVVTCAVKEKSDWWYNEKKNEEDDWRFEVISNYPTAIERKTPGKAKVGKPIKFELKGIYDINYADSVTIEWQLSGPEMMTVIKSKEFLFIPRHNGTYTLTVKMNERAYKRPVSFECITCEIVNGWWTDSDGNMLTGEDDKDVPSNTIGSAGWKQEVVAAFCHSGLNDEEVTIEVFDKDKNGTVSVYTKDITVPSTKNGATCSFPLNDVIKDKVKKDGRAPDGLLYFTVKAKNGLKIINNGMSLPKNGGYLEVNDSIRAKAYFSDNNDTKRYGTAALDTPVYVQVKSKNLIDEDLELEICKSIEWLTDKVLGNRIAFKVDKYGMASVKLPMDAIKAEIPNATDSVQVYAKIYIKGDTDFTFDGDGSYMLTVYKTLATSPASIGTTKAFVVVDVSEGEKSEYCSNCDKDITLDDIKKICVSEKNSKNEEFCLIEDLAKITEALPFLNKYRQYAQIKTCVSKAHFLAQLSHESKFYLFQENFKYSDPERMRKIFFAYFNQFGTIENQKKEAKRLSDLSMNRSNHQIVANAIYGKTHPIGKNHLDENDGWRYSGKGFKQITWKDNYVSLQKYVNENFNIKVEWVNGDNPYKLKNIAQDAIISALAFWVKKNIHLLATDVSDNSVEKVTAVINKAGEGIDERKRYFRKSIKILGADKCKFNGLLGGTEKGTIVVVSGISTTLGEEKSGSNKQWPVYETLVYRGLNLETYNRLNHLGKLPNSNYKTFLTRDAHMDSDSRSTERYGTSNEVPPGTYYLNKGSIEQKYDIYLSDMQGVGSCSISGIHGIREGVAIHGGWPEGTIGCLSTHTSNYGNKSKKQPINPLVKELIDNIPDFDNNNDDRPVILIIEERNAIKKESLWNGTSTTY